MRIVCVRGVTGPSGDWRISNPAEALRRRGHEVKVLNAWEHKGWSAGWFAGYDACLLQLIHDQTFLEMIGSIPERERPATIYEVDDLIWQVGPEREDIYSLFQAVRQGAMRCVRRCDAVFCSTPELVEEVSSLNARAFCIPNAIDFSLRDWTAKAPRCPGHEVIIGWAGGVRSGKDFEPIGDALRQVLEQCPQAAFAIAGDPEIVYDFAWCLGVPANQLYVLDLSPFETYPGLLSCFDIGIAPLADGRFNRCKSELKLMEYGAKSIPYVASAMPAYERFDRNTGHVGGFLASNTRQWRQGLLALVQDRAARESMGAACKLAVEREYNLARTAELYERRLLDVAPRNTEAEPREIAIR